MAATVSSQGGRDAFEEFLMGSGRVTTVSHKLWEKLVQPGDTVVDGTVGNGHDTLNLAKLAVTEGGDAGRVVGFDVQDVAIRATACKLDQDLTPAQAARVELLHLCHSRMGEFVRPREARLVCFNLGYLPGGDKDVMTLSSSTTAALQAATEAIMVGGLLNIIAYRHEHQHDGGEDEYATVLSFVRALEPKEWNVVSGDMLNRHRSPVLICCYRKT